MTYLIGTDEAGYGPNLGPLVITATAWQVPDTLSPSDLYDLLADAISRAPVGRDAPRLSIADSKQLYSPGRGLGLLERGVASALRICDLPASRWRQLWQTLAELTDDQLDRMPWHCGYDHDLPLDCAAEDIERTAQFVQRSMTQAGVQLLAVRSAAVFPCEFNELVAVHGNKASLLSQCTLGLVTRLLEHCRDGRAMVMCDKHGGRNRYGPLLQTRFPDDLVEVVRESRDLSVYRWGPGARRREFRFLTQGEQLLPTALASMVSKYLRELAMRAFNEFWLRQVPGLRPTAGYPVDARRFQQQIAVRQRALGIPDGVLWRTR